MRGPWKVLKGLLGVIPYKGLLIKYWGGYLIGGGVLIKYPLTVSVPKIEVLLSGSSEYNRGVCGPVRRL